MQKRRIIRLTGIVARATAAAVALLFVGGCGATPHRSAGVPRETESENWSATIDVWNDGACSRWPVTAKVLVDGHPMRVAFAPTLPHSTLTATSALRAHIDLARPEPRPLSHPDPSGFNGLDVPAWPSRPTTVAFGGHVVGTPQEWLVRDIPALSTCGLDGLVSPQALVGPDDFVELDIRNHALRRWSGAAGVERFSAVRRGGTDLVRCVNEYGTPAFAVVITFRDWSMAFLLNASSPRGYTESMGLPETGTLTARGFEVAPFQERVNAGETLPTTLTIGEFRPVVGLVVRGGAEDWPWWQTADDASMCWYGRPYAALGLDVLQYCTMIFSRDAGAMACSDSK